MFVGSCGCCEGPCSTWLTDNGEWKLMIRSPGNTIDSLQGLTWDESEIWKSMFKNWEISQILFRYDKVSQNDAWVLVARSKYDEMDRIKQNPIEFYNTHRWTVVASKTSWMYRPSSRFYQYNNVENPPDVRVPARIIIKDDSTGVVYVDELRALLPGSPQCFRSKIEKGTPTPNELSLYVYVLKSFMGIQKRDDFVDPDREAYMTELYATNDPIALEIASKTPYEWDRINNVDIADHDYNYLIENSYGSSLFPTWLRYSALPAGEIYKQFGMNYVFLNSQEYATWTYWDESTYLFPPIDKQDVRWNNFTNRYSQKLSLAQEAVAYTLEVYGEDSNEYKKAVTDLEDIERIIDWGQRKKEADYILLYEILPSIENWRLHFNDMLFLCRARYFNNRQINGARNIYAEKGFSQFDDNKSFAKWTYERQYDKLSGEYVLNLNVTNKQRELFFDENYERDFRNPQGWKLRDPPSAPLHCMFSDGFSSEVLIRGQLRIFVSAEFEGGGWDTMYGQQWDLSSTEAWQNLIEQKIIFVLDPSNLAYRPDLISNATFVPIPIYMDLGSDIYTGKLRIDILAGEGIDARASLSCPELGCVTSTLQGLSNTRGREIRVKSYVKSVKVTIQAQDYDLDISQGYSIWRLNQKGFMIGGGDERKSYYFCPLQAQYEVIPPSATGGSSVTFTKVGEKRWNSKYKWPGSKFNGTFELVRRPDRPSIFEHIIDPLTKHQISSGPRRTPDGLNACTGREASPGTTLNREIPVYNQNVIYAYDDPDVPSALCGVFLNAFGYWAVNDGITEDLTPKYDADAFQFRGPSCGNVRLASFDGSSAIRNIIFDNWAWQETRSLLDIFYRYVVGGGADIELWRNRPADFTGDFLNIGGWHIRGPVRSRNYFYPTFHEQINTNVFPSNTQADRFMPDYARWYLGCKEGNYFDTNYNDEVRDGWREVHDGNPQTDYLTHIGYEDSPFPLRHNSYGFAALPLHAFAFDNNVRPSKGSYSTSWGQTTGNLGDCFKVFGNNRFNIRHTDNRVLARYAQASDVVYHEFPKLWDGDGGFFLGNATGAWPLAATWGQLYDRYINETGDFSILCTRVEITTAD